jgi:hypothetical protein
MFTLAFFINKNYFSIWLAFMELEKIIAITMGMILLLDKYFIF